jgi:hypothetical protein
MKTTVGVPIALFLLLAVLDLPGTTALFAIAIPRRSTFTAFVGTACGGSWSLQKRRQQQLGSLQKHQATSSATTEAAETSKATTTVITTAKDRLESLLQPEQRPLNDKHDATATTSKQQPAAAAAAAAVLLVNVTLTQHRPLGCIVEESVALTNTLPHLVFVASVSPNGHAAKAGIQVGDVIVAMSGLFGQVESVLGQGIDIVYVKVSVSHVVQTLLPYPKAMSKRVRSHTTVLLSTNVLFHRSKSLVSSCPDSEPLQLQLLRGTSVLSDHEAALVELCANPDTSDAETEQCMLDYLQGGYYNENDSPVGEECNGDDEQECLLDNLQSMWAGLNDDDDDDRDGSSTSSAASATTATAATSTTTVTKPWSSRSSPSGTFVRDPSTGQMRNIN